jgi:hypothetical protein
VIIGMVFFLLLQLRISIEALLASLKIINITKTTCLTSDFLQNPNLNIKEIIKYNLEKM